MNDFNTVYKKGLSEKVKKYTDSVHNAKQLKKALMHINNTFPESLCESTKVSRLKTSRHPNLYTYRANNNVRILFSIDNNTKIVHDIINMKDISSR